jgi:hypothetical protein
LSLVLVILVSIAIAIISIGLIYGAEVSFAPVIGVMLGTLYSFTDYEDGREHTLQVCIFFISITVQWNQT